MVVGHCWASSSCLFGGHGAPPNITPYRHKIYILTVTTKMLPSYIKKNLGDQFLANFFPDYSQRVTTMGENSVLSEYFLIKGDWSIFRRIISLAIWTVHLHFLFIKISQNIDKKC